MPQEYVEKTKKKNFHQCGSLRNVTRAADKTRYDSCHTDFRWLQLVTFVCPSFSKEAGRQPQKCFWSGCSLACIQDSTYLLEKPPG